MQRKFFPLIPLSSFLGVVLTILCWTSPSQAVDFLSDESYEDQATSLQVGDPIEPFNRAMFTFNDKAYIWVIDPVVTGYSKVLPADIRGCIGNFFYNIGEPIRSANSLLQGRVQDSGLILGRFIINTIFGVFGLADPASNEFNIAPVYATLGETLSAWGVGDGFYLVVPLMGPSTLRDFVGTVGDGMVMWTYSPLWNDNEFAVIAAEGVHFANRTSFRLGEYEQLKSLSFDPYIAFRSGYFQVRSKQRNHSKKNNY